METTVKTRTSTRTARTAGRNPEQVLAELNRDQATVKKYKAKLGYGYDANDPNGLGNRITAEDVCELVKKKLL